jgi:hypothetical protein
MAQEFRCICSLFFICHFYRIKYQIERAVFVCICTHGLVLGTPLMTTKCFNAGEKWTSSRRKLPEHLELRRDQMQRPAGPKWKPDQE